MTRKQRSHDEQNNTTSNNSKTADASRRHFVKGSALVAGGMASGIVGGNLDIARAAHSGADETIRIGLVGCGGRGTGAASQAMNTQEKGPVKLVAMGDAFPDRLQSSLRSMKTGKQGAHVDVPKDRQFIGFDAYKKVFEQDLEMVILATPPGFRPLHFEAAVNAGKHVFMEKPVATDAPGVRRVIAAGEEAKKKNLAVAVGLQRHHETTYRDTIKALQDGIIGDINFMRAYWNGTTPWVRKREANHTELEYQMRNWYFFNWICGDHITEQHIHNLDVINWLKDSYPVKAQGMGGRQVRTDKIYGEIYDHHMIEYTYADGSKMLSACRHQQGTWRQVNEFAHGSNGDCHIGAGKITLHNGGEIKYNRPKGEPGGHQNEHHDLFASLRQGKIPNEAAYGAKSTMTSIMGRMATYTGRELSWEECFQSKLALANVDELKTFDDKAPVQPNENLEYAISMPGKNNVKVL